MATSKSHHISTPNYRFLPILETEYSLSDSPSFDFDDSDLFTSPPSNDSHDFRKTLRSSRYSKPSSPSVSTSLRPASLPVNVPDWSKILGREYRGNRRKDNLYDDEDGDDVSDDGERGGGGGGGRVPPHEYLARTRMASLSVHEGVGRTLKGRDLSRVRNAIWAKTGFQD